MKNINKRFYAGVLIIIILVIVGVYSFNKTSNETTYTIGAILELTGVNATQGENSQRGIMLAVDEINANGGINGKELVVNFQDNEGDNPKGALSALQNLKNQGVSIIIGPNNTPSANAIAPALSSSGILAFAPSVGSEKFAEHSDLAFNLFPPNKFDSYQLAEYIYNQEGLRSIAILGYKQEWSIAQAEFVKERFEELGGTVVDVQLPADGSDDMRTVALKIKNSNPDAIVFTNWANTGVSAKRLREIGFTKGFYSIVFPLEQIQVAGGALEGMTYISTDTTNEEFNASFEKKYGNAPGFSASQIYDITKMIAQAIENTGGTNAKKIAKELHKIETWDGASGYITLDSDGNSHKPGNYFTVVNGVSVAK